MIKQNLKTVQKEGLWYKVQNGNKRQQFKPWLGDLFSFLYDRIMEKSIFPKKFGGDIKRHYEILALELREVHDKNVLEVATGSGSAVHFLPKDNRYTGTDISPGLLKRAVTKFRRAGFREAQFYVARADDLPFDDHMFDVSLCILSLNFMGDVRRVLEEMKRVLTAGGAFFCSVPVPERNRQQSTIRGTLHSEEELGMICQAQGFRFEPIPCENGALLYFKAFLRE